VTTPGPGAPPPGYIYPVVTPADTEWLSTYYLTPLMAPTPVATRLPDDTDPDDTVNGFISVESSGGPKVSLIEYNQTIILHTYCAEEYEPQGFDIARNAVAWMGAASGLTISGWQITDVPRVTSPQRRNDPKVPNLLRYLAMVTWTVVGQPVQSAS
jgi:hypothetical protein